MKRKLFALVMAMLLCFVVTACGGGQKVESAEKVERDAFVTVEMYQKLLENYSGMTPEEMVDYVNVEYVENEERTKDWGEGYLVVDFPGPDESSGIRVLFKEGDDGKMKPSSVSATGQFTQK